MTRALVVGVGSIGTRHVEVLSALGCDVAVVSRRGPFGTHRTFATIAEGVAGVDPEYVVLARETARHGGDVTELAEAGFHGRVLVEKPLTSAPVALPLEGFARVGVAYNLRFHPVLERLRTELAGARIATVTAHAGQHLSTWRPGTDHRSSYSADPAAGGGVLRDLSHELDYLLWMFGPWKRVAAQGGRSGVLNVASDDAWAVLLELDRCALVSLQLDYLDRIGQRRVVVTTEEHTFVADLVAGRLAVDGAVEELPADRHVTYRRQHEAMLGSDQRPCTAAEGIEVVRLIAAIETAAHERRWVTP
ncbi:Gfo/Idh/MocA family protein [Nitriliruptor alkaliphilus]|uniref:Gfo/Idh/MocA family protein n=1 Tax=Nitriliruptor alkaliphilus TaxID=427918 RepID=UPI000697D04B|nr:Gfo/Idh/MocA family oxidoreductase [Nitriliruptor alkaliphilus]